MSKTLKVVLSVAVVIAIAGAYVFPQVKTIVGAVSGPDFYFDYFGVNEVRTYPTRQSLTLATTTPCAIKSPSATSTLVSASLKITVASSTATTWTVAKATTAFATTTPLNGNFSLGSGVQGTMVYFASSTSSTVDANSVFAPNTYLVWSVAGVRPAGTGLGGICQAQFLRI